jgi:hypothetical protein
MTIVPRNKKRKEHVLVRRKINKGTLTICDKVEAINEHNECDGCERGMWWGMINRDLNSRISHKSPDKQEVSSERSRQLRIIVNQLHYSY